jgi:hypothetical protein
LVGSVNNETSSSLAGWLKLYNLTFLVGVAISFTVMVVVSYIFSPPGLGLDEPFHDAGSETSIRGDVLSSPPGSLLDGGEGITSSEVKLIDKGQ